MDLEREKVQPDIGLELDQDGARQRPNGHQRSNLEGKLQDRAPHSLNQFDCLLIDYETSNSIVHHI
jgi:hypothetical protein